MFAGVVDCRLSVRILDVAVAGSTVPEKDMHELCTVGNHYMKSKIRDAKTCMDIYSYILYVKEDEKDRASGTNGMM